LPAAFEQSLGEVLLVHAGVLAGRLPEPLPLGRRMRRDPGRLGGAFAQHVGPDVEVIPTDPFGEVDRFGPGLVVAIVDVVCLVPFDRERPRRR
jgi:hypothetical protein